jgi:error-prone DNA polymerase
LKAAGGVHLHLHSPYSFCDGAASVGELVGLAAAQGLTALALTDHNNLAGAVRWQKHCRHLGLKPILGAEVTLEEGYHLTLLAMNRQGYANLCSLLTEAHLTHPRRQPATSWEALGRWAEGLVALSGCRQGPLRVLFRRRREAEAELYARRLLEIFGPHRFFLELQRDLYPGERHELAFLCHLARRLGLRTVATHNIHYLRREDMPVHDVLTCIRTHVALEEPHAERPLNAERYLRGPAEMVALFQACPAAVATAQEIAEMCEDYQLGGPEYAPRYPTEGLTSAALLRHLALAGARQRYTSLSPPLLERLEHELNIICQLGFADYFLIVWDALRYARRRGIRYAGRGSCADSVVAYALGITQVDAWRRKLCFERFINPARLGTLPDIDVDFDARYRDEIAAYLTKRYGEEHVAGVCTFQCFRARGALREVAKVFSVPETLIAQVARYLPSLDASALREAFSRYPELRHSGLEWQRLEKVLEIATRLSGLPRHLGTHLGGVVISAQPLSTLSPLQLSAKGGRIISFDKEDVEDLGLFKLDLLSLRMLGAVEDAVRWSQADYERLPLEDRATYEMLSRGEAIGAFQLESPAQRSLHQRLHPRSYEDLVASVALIRPGPVQADMVSPFLARRCGREPVVFTDPRVEKILAKTYGVVLFQEQVIELAVEIAGFTPAEADQLRRLMTHNRDREALEKLAADFIARALAKGAAREVAEMAFKAIRSFAGYGFCEGHAAAFADIGYRTAYLLRHYPAQFYAALLNNQPMGFYPAHTLINQAQLRGVKILPPDINASGTDYAADEGWLRVGLKQIKGIRAEELAAIAAARATKPFSSLEDFLTRVPVQSDTAEALVLVGSFDSLHPNRRALLWYLQERLCGQGRLPLAMPVPAVEDFSPEEKALYEWDLLGFSLTCHPLQLLRPRLQKAGVVEIAKARQYRAGRQAKIAGLAIRPHRPPTRSGKTTVFLTLEDETGLLDVTVFEEVYHRYATALFGSGLLLVEGQVQRSHGLALIATQIHPLAATPTTPSSTP